MARQLRPAGPPLPHGGERPLLVFPPPWRFGLAGISCDHNHNRGQLAGTIPHIWWGIKLFQSNVCANRAKSKISSIWFSGFPLPYHLPTERGNQLPSLPRVEGDLVAVVQCHPCQRSPTVCRWKSDHRHLHRPVRMILRKYSRTKIMHCLPLRERNNHIYWPGWQYIFSLGPKKDQ